MLLNSASLTYPQPVLEASGKIVREGRGDSVRPGVRTFDGVSNSQNARNPRRQHSNARELTEYAYIGRYCVTPEDMYGAAYECHTIANLDGWVTKRGIRSVAVLYGLR